MTRTEERLADALGAAALALREDTLRPLQGPERGRHRLDWIAPVAAATPARTCACIRIPSRRFTFTPK